MFSHSVFIGFWCDEWTQSYARLGRKMIHGFKNVLQIENKKVWHVFVIKLLERTL